MVNAFLLMGQSNMAGRGVIGELPALDNPNVWMLCCGRWVQAKEPVHRDRPDTGEGLALSFGNALSGQSGKTVGLIPCAVGGTKLEQWGAGEQLFRNTQQAAWEAMRLGGVIQGILWHQGEGDARERQTAECYCERLLAMFQALLQALKLRNVPIIVGELGRYLAHSQTYPFADEVNRQLHHFVQLYQPADCVSADELTDKGDGLHFCTASLREMGRRYAKACQKFALTL